MLTGKSALVFGASSGMGRATALLFARAGAQVTACARRKDELERLRAEAQGENRIIVAPCDVTVREQVVQAVDDCVKATGKIDVVVFASGTNIRQRAIEVLSEEDWHLLMETNLTGAFHVTQAVLPHMRAQGDGLIIYISSTSARAGDMSGVAYQATKRGLLGLAAGTFVEERMRGIRTTVIMPGLTDTPLVQQRPTPPTPEMLARALKPEDVAEACLFVAKLPAHAHVPEVVMAPARL